MDDTALEKYADTFGMVSEKLNSVTFPSDVGDFCFKQMTKVRLK